MDDGIGVAFTVQVHYPDELKEVKKNRNPWSLYKFKVGHLHGVHPKMDNRDVFGGKKV